MMSKGDEFLKNNKRLNWPTRARHNQINATIIQIICDFIKAYIVIPDEEYIKPFIMADSKHILKYPHIENSGKLCLPEFLENINTLEEQIEYLLDIFFNDYLNKIKYTDCFQDFMAEAQHYWDVFIDLHNKKHQLWKFATPELLLCHERSSSKFLEYYSLFIERTNQVISKNKNDLYGEKVISFLSKGQTVSKLRTIEISLNHALLPENYPRNLKELRIFLNNHLGMNKSNSFLQKRDRPCLLVLRSETCDYGYLINFNHKNIVNFSNNLIIPLSCEKVDLNWIYGRYQNKSIESLQKRHIVCFGAGVLASYVLPLLIREGIGEITLIDYDNFNSANLARHFLGMESLGNKKVHALKNAFKNLPSCKINAEPFTAQKWLEKNKLNDDSIDLIVDLTGSMEVREAVSFYRKKYSSKVQLVTGWMEPYVCAGHVAIFTPSIFWSQSLWEDQAAFHDWPDEYLVNEPGCVSKFQPYSGIQANAVASLIASKIVALVKGTINNNTVFSLVQNDSYCAQQPHQATRQSWAKFDDNIESLVLKRDISS